MTGVQTCALPIWDGSGELAALLTALQSGGKAFAMAPDEGPSRTIGGFVAQYRAPKFAAAVSERPDIAQQRYLNAGFMVFSDRAVLQEWRERSNLLEGDTCWEQNALNQLAYESSRGLVLDARVWNVHAALLRDVRVAGGEFQCGGQRPVFVHATSASTSDVADEVTTVSRGGYSSEAYLRRFGNDALNREQHKLLSGFLLAHADELKELNILKRAATKLGRNDPCHCGSGKKLKKIGRAHV